MPSLLDFLAISLLLVACACLTIGLTFAPCYATLCPEEYSPLETRLHLAFFYIFIALSSCALLLRDSCKAMKSFSGIHLISSEIPLLSKRVTVGGVLVSLWAVGPTFAMAAIWVPVHLDFWGSRTDPLDWDTAKLLLTITGFTGHYADVLLGLLVIPVSRHSLVGRAFGIHQSTLLSAHRLIAYLFLAATLAHGVAYGVYALNPSSDGNAARDKAFATGNPAMTLAESETRSSWHTYTTETGAAALVLLIIIVLTALPVVRRRFYNVFYYCHLVTAVLVFIAAGVHVSTNLYLLLPGLALWTIDWARRFFGGEAGGFHKTVMTTVEDAGNGWRRISLPPLKLNDAQMDSLPSIEDGKLSGNPLLCYHLNFPAVSKLQNHPFTAAIPSSTTSGSSFLFQPTQRKSQKSLKKEWTWKLATLSSPSISLKARVEGPYWPNERGFDTASHIICTVGGTGITGALSLAHWWRTARAMVDESRFTLIWTVRNAETANVKEWLDLQHIGQSIDRMNLVTHATSQKQRLDPSIYIKEALEVQEGSTDVHSEKKGNFQSRVGLVYSSGPNGLVRATSAGSR